MLIKNSVTRVTVRHHGVCWVMLNCYPSDGIFNLHRRTIMDSFSCILFLRQLHLDLNTVYVLFYQFYARITTFFDQEQFDTAPVLYVDAKTFGRNWHENDVRMSKVTSNHQNRQTDVIPLESSYTSHVRQHFLVPVGFTEIPVGYARKAFLSHFVFSFQAW